MIVSKSRRFPFVPAIVAILLFVAEGVAWGQGFAVTDSPALAAGANLRVMSYNILSEEWNAKTPIDGRQDSVSQTIRHFAPDVVGLQEVSVKWYGVLPGLLLPKYEMVQTTNSKGESNYTGMAYHTEKVKLLDSGTELYSVGAGGTKIRLVTWGYYEKLDNGAKFVVMNTHWCIREPNRLVHAQEMADLFAKLREKYNCPVVTVGDHNADQNDQEYKDFASKTGMKNARVNAEKKNRDFRTAHSLGKKPRPLPDSAIDQIFYTDELTCLFYNVLIDQVILDASDHCPIYADFKLEQR
ncbi:MAG TPA: endonuclease/exonuclease/phosphatase family protein [Tepidisphaeraceae bacterium]|jgi:endonuclease/exonuclease/phosphatase family metal-dependent hydrolase|nr:endonuclease/exonuclease/phosphatase family protein [Tepidisphaeraceae bacterium]